MARVELVIGAEGFISGFIVKNSPFPSSWFFQKKTYSERDMKNVADVFCNIVSQTMGGARGSYCR